MSRFPQPNRTVALRAQHDRVVPPPHHDVGTVRPCGDRDQMAGRHPLHPRGGEHGGEPDGADVTAGPYLTGVLGYTQDARSPESVRGVHGIGMRSRHVPQSRGRRTR